MKRRMPRTLIVVLVLMGLWVIVGTVGLIGYVLTAGDPALEMEGPAAVRRSPECDVEVLACSGEKVRELTVEAVDVMDVEKDKREARSMWSLRFDPPVTLQTVSLGTVPPGAVEEEKWQPELLVDQRNRFFFVSFQQNDDRFRNATFELADLQGGSVLFGDERMTNAEFEGSEVRVSTLSGPIALG